MPQERLRRVAQECQAIAHTDAEFSHATDDRLILLAGHPQQEDLDLGVAPPYSACIEDDRDPLRLTRDIQQALASDLSVSLSTASANRLLIAQAVVRGIAVHRPLQEDVRQNIELAVHEAVTNALIHGNLQIDSIARLSTDALAEFSEQLSCRLNDPDYSRRRIDIRVAFEPNEVVVDVIDEGEGYSPAVRHGETSAFGRGIDLIIAVAKEVDVLDGGWRIRMRFTL